MLDKSLLQQIKQRYGVVGNCEQLNYALEVCLQAAPTDLSVLVFGESGVGKEILPRIIHDKSLRSKGKYFAINCGSIPEGTIDSELFGHERGAFTGAIGESEGYFGAANNGTLFLDEVGELPLATQARLLRVLETGEYIRVGGTEIRKTNVRIVAATNVNLERAISEGKFREDLFYRLNTIPVHMPPLRERGNDVLLLFRLFVLQMMEKYHMPRLELNEAAQQLLLKYKWPGNIRQLKNITEQICVLSGDERLINAEMLLRYIPNDKESMEMTARTTTASGSSHGYESERQILYSLIFELQSNMATLNNELVDLKKQVAALGGMPQGTQNPILALPPAHHQLTDTTTHAITLPEHNTAIQMGDRRSAMHFEDAVAEELTPVQEVRVDTESENLNIHDIEIEKIKKALERHGGNRRKAAQELGISDRTLYRRLKSNNLAK